MKRCLLGTVFMEKTLKTNLHVTVSVNVCQQERVQIEIQSNIQILLDSTKTDDVISSKPHFLFLLG
jgi:hypothetical protein